MDYLFLGSISACLPRGSAMASLVTTCRCAETQISNAHRAFCCLRLRESEEESHLQRLCQPLLPQRSGARLGAKTCNSIHGHDLFGKSSRVSQVSNSPALLMFCSGINVGQALKNM